jgi:hypothetical protein
MQIVYSKIDQVVEIARNKLTPERLESFERGVAKVSEKGSIAAALTILVVGMAIDVGIRTVLLGVIGVFVVGYLGNKFSPACQSAVTANPTKVSTRAYFDVLALLMILAITGGVLGGAYMIFEVGFDQGVTIIGGALTLLILLTLTLHPSMISVEVDPNASAGQDLIGLTSVYLKSALRTVNLLSSLYIIGGMTLVLVGAFGEEYERAGDVAAGITVILAGMALPALLFLGFVVLYFFIDLLDNVLSIKGRPTLSSVSAPGNVGSAGSADPMVSSSPVENSGAPDASDEVDDY